MDNFKLSFESDDEIVRRKINSLTENGFHGFIELLDDDELCSLFLSMSNERFIELSSDFQKQKVKKKNN